MRFATVCSGIGGGELAWTRLGWQSAWCAEVDPFASAVLATRFPVTPNLGDFTRIRKGVDADAVDVLGGGTPCQSFSVAGLRKGLDDARGNLTLEFLGLVGRLLPRWVVWENVPGALSIDGGRTFGAFLGLLGELGYGFAYRVLDAQYFGLAQRRRRVFVVAYRGDWRPPAAVLFEPDSVSGNLAPGREAGADVAGTLGCGSPASGGRVGPDEVAAHQVVAHALRADGFDASEDGTGRGTPLVPMTFMAADYKTGFYEETETARPLTTSADRTRSAPIALTPFDPTQLTHPENRSNPQPGDPAPTLPRDGHGVAIAIDLRNGTEGECAQTLQSAGIGKDRGGSPNSIPHTMAGSAVRRLTPRECERLQGFPDDWTLVPYRGKPAADGPRYRAIGNAWPVPVIEWIGARIALCEDILREVAA